MVIRAFTIPNNPSVAIIGATLAIGPEFVCFKSMRINASSMNALSDAPAIIAITSASQ